MEQLMQVWQTIQGGGFSFKEALFILEFILIIAGASEFFAFILPARLATKIPNWIRLIKTVFKALSYIDKKLNESAYTRGGLTTQIDKEVDETNEERKKREQDEKDLKELKELGYA
jgi:hypothetical protein